MPSHRFGPVVGVINGVTSLSSLVLHPVLPAWYRAKLGAGRLGLIVVLIKFLGLRAMSLKGVIATRMFLTFGREWSNKSMSSQPRYGKDAEVLIFSLIGDGDSNHSFLLFG